MYFDNHLDFSEARINPDLFWEYNMDSFDFGSSNLGALVMRKPQI
jgi:hypothetical protein